MVWTFLGLCFGMFLRINDAKFCSISSNKLVCNRLEIGQEFFSTEYKHKIQNLDSIFFKLKSKQILNKNFLNGVNLWNTFDQKYQIFWFKNLLGFDINLFIKLGTNYSNFYSFYLYNSKMLFLNGTHRAECANIYPDENFEINFVTFSLMKNINFKSKLCLYFFNKVKIQYLKIKYLTNTFYKKNILSFLKINDRVDISVKFVLIENCDNIHLTDYLIDLQFFKQTKVFNFLGKIKSIQRNLFASLTSVRFIAIDIYFAKQLIHRNTIEWIEELNQAVKPNQLNRIIHISITHKFYPEYYFLLDINHLFPDEDFCFYKKFPFKKLILLSAFDNGAKKRVDQYSCTFLWLAQEYHFFLNYSSYITNGQLFYATFSSFLNKTNFSRCNFEKRLEKCHLQSVKIQNEFDLFFFKDLIVLIDYGIIVYSIPVVSLACFVLNVLTFYFFFKNRKSKELTNTHYKFIKIYSFLSLVYVSFKLVDMIDECPFENGKFCSSIISLVIVQCYKIILNDFLMRVIKVCIHFSLLGYTIFRLNLFISPNSRLHKYISNLSISKLVFISLFSFGLISTPKLFLHGLNNDDPNLNYPSYFLDAYSSFIVNSFGETTLITLNLVSDFTNTFLIILINFIFDISLAFRLKLSIKKMLSEKKRSRANKKYLHQMIISFVMILLNMILKSTEIFHSVYFLLGYSSRLRFYELNTKLQFFLNVICLRFSFPAVVNHFLDLSFLVLNMLNYLVYFFSDSNFRKVFILRKEKQPCN
ncbi:hypothetical protein BpHYR1_028898 [Brachionus plicatilis]|uniref:G-protein coupled receptors family 1 profile domain-containing protein n=1 Tax=Brachionus plicatilis TaxID=10195 RepID=A0A3M7RZ74_BRAPC|nr:hypothetical protein BpHYR1_028898 [Brachionus plicatilis]